MGMIFSVGSTTYGSLTSANGKYALSEVIASGIYDIIRYHVKGVDGSYLTRGGLIGYNIKLKMRYVSTTPYADLRADSDTWENTAVTIVAQNGGIYPRCTLDPGGLRVTRDAIAMGRGVVGQQFIDVEANFTGDGVHT